MKLFVALLMLSFPLQLLFGDQPIDPPKNEHDWHGNDDRNFLPLGEITRKQILAAKVFNYHYVEYAPQSDPVEAIHNLEQPVQIKVFFGDWCKDSKKHIPAFIKTLEFADSKNLDVIYINLSPDKKQPEELVAGFNIEKVPTFVVLSSEQELGRIVEAPEKTVEEDLVAILEKL